MVATREHAKRYDVPNDLPGEVETLLSDLREKEGTGEIESGVTNAYLSDLHKAGWSLRALANAFGGVTAQAIKFRIQGTKTSHDLEVPEPPRRASEKAQAEQERRESRYVIPTAVAKRMAKLQPLARQYRGTTPPDHPNAKASRELTALMHRERENGATLAEIGEAAGVTWNAVKFRLGRYGLEGLPPSAQDTLLTELKDEEEEGSE